MTPDIEALRALLARVEGASGPDREIDQDLFCDLGLCPRGEDGVLDAYRAPAYTASLDAAADLAAKTLPLSGEDYRPGDYTYTIMRRFDGVHRVTLSRSGGERRWGVQPEVYASTLPLAMCEAVVRALIAQAEAPAAR